MEQSSSSFPHVYYTVNEISHVTDAKTLKNVNIKTLGFVEDNRIYSIDFKNETVEKGSTFVKVDLSHVKESMDGIRPYLIFGVLFTIHGAPHISVKSIKKFIEGMQDLCVYHHQCLAIRIRCPHYVNIAVTNTKSTNK
ncbi:hypothetical protein RUM43_009983 [Polyplax serrata]|uniref:Uncharacterized protein n=1 Tax=Polyplax serrata TaxID=468196 RepID=A0AAN8S4K7_POLSC